MMGSFSLLPVVLTSSGGFCVVVVFFLWMLAEKKRWEPSLQWQVLQTFAILQQSTVEQN